MTSLVCNFVDLIIPSVESVATEVMAQRLRRDDIRIPVEDLIDARCCHFLRLTANKQI